MFEMFRLNVCSVSTIVQSLKLIEHLIALLLVEIALLIFIKRLKLLDQVVIPLLDEVVDSLLETTMELRIENSQKHVHQQEETESQVEDEEYRVYSSDLVSRQHEVREVGCCHQD